MYRAPRGTVDILPQEQAAWAHIVNTAEGVAQRYGYSRIDTPIFEEASLFTQGVGEATDIVDKEMYVFKDRGNNTLSLRPEGTAAVCRAYLEHGMASWPQPVKLYYIGQQFRYDRPQAGRYRQFHQFGIEALGEPDAALDAEAIDLQWRVYTELGLHDLTLAVNSIGDSVCRPEYIKALTAYYASHLDDVCATCRERYERNVLRLLDCKEERCQPFIDEAPHSADYLCSDCQAHYDLVRGYLGALDIPFVENHRLVRGLDYYTRTIWEVEPKPAGSQSALGGGGRYDGLIEALGGRSTPGVGFAVGIERILLALRQQEAPLPQPQRPVVYVAPIGAIARQAAMRLAAQLRSSGISAVLGVGDRSLRAHLRSADALGARYAAILGETELAEGMVTLRNMRSSEQQKVAMQNVSRAVAWKGILRGLMNRRADIPN
jgi:histidyl-tRNA synthetase